MKSSWITLVVVLFIAGVAAPFLMAAEERVELKPTYPRPLFIGTPKDIKSDNLEPKKKKNAKRKPLMVPKGTKNVALKKPVTSSDMAPIIGELEMVTDGDKESNDGSYVELGPNVQHVTIDLGAPHKLYAIVVWHYHAQARVYRDVIVQVATDKDFTKNVHTVFNNDHDKSAKITKTKGTNYEYIETNKARIIDAKGEIAQYVRLYSNGSTDSEMNHYVEVEVHGIAK